MQFKVMKKQSNLFVVEMVPFDIITRLQSTTATLRLLICLNNRTDAVFI